MAFSSKKLATVCLLLVCIQQAYPQGTEAPTQTTEDPAPVPLMCYICDNCPTVDTSTPVEECNAQYFDPKTTTTEAVTETTIPTFTDEPLTSESTTTTTTTTTPPPTTTPPVSDTTSGESTEPPMPTPPTVGPPETTTAVPTPTNVGTVAGVNDLEVSTPSINSSVTTTKAAHVTEPTIMHVVRQLRQVTNTDVTYHCYTIKRKENNTLITQRGCSRVTTMQGVCEQLKLTTDTITKCNPCSEQLCNGSRTLAVSAATLLIAVLALLLNRN